jgi:hypothetical protein
MKASKNSFTLRHQCAAVITVHETVETHTSAVSFVKIKFLMNAGIIRKALLSVKLTRRICPNQDRSTDLSPIQAGI